jgi:hypothetical protein
MGRQKHGWGKADVNGFTCPLIFGGKRTVIARLVRNCALGRAIQYSRDSSDRFERPRRTGYPAFAGYDDLVAARPDPMTTD